MTVGQTSQTCLVKLAPRLVLSSFPIHRARHLLDRKRSLDRIYRGVVLGR
jgi:hypothetical protein